jgi:hypothetical protein
MIKMMTVLVMIVCFTPLLAGLILFLLLMREDRKERGLEEGTERREGR